MANIIFYISIFIALIGVLIALVRMIKGPTAADRAVSLDVMTIISISVIVFIAFFTGREIYLDVAMIYALISFLGVVAVARYLEGSLKTCGIRISQGSAKKLKILPASQRPDSVE